MSSMYKLWERLSRGTDRGIEQFLRYVVVGAVAFGVDYGVFCLLHYSFGLAPIVANTLSFILGLLANYFLSRTWVFNQKTHRFGRDFVLFAIIGVIGLLLSDGLLYVLLDCKVLSHLFGNSFGKQLPSIAKLITVAVVFLWNFFARKKIIF